MNLRMPKANPPSVKEAEIDNLPPRQPSKIQKTERYVVSVDHQAKSSFDTLQNAETEAARIRGLFPKLRVEVSDATENSIDTLGPTVIKDEEED